MAQEKDITFFVPCYNEQANIAVTIDTIKEAVGDFSLDYEILIYDDASVDNTRQVAENIIRDNPQVSLRLVCNQKNRGLGFNYFRGAFLARSRYYMLINGDNVEPAEQIKAILEHYGKYDMVIPYFDENDKRSLFRRTLSKIFSFLVNSFSGHKIRYYNGAVLHLTENVRFWRAETMGYGYQSELVCRLLHEGKSYIQVKVSNTDRQWGSSKAFALSNILSLGNSLFHILWRRLEYTVFDLLKPGVADPEKLPQAPEAEKVYAQNN